ncbi:MAG: hypothetical protein APU95_05905 [Hadesarchaea archaeon YNP_N21]|jgi:Holliday junction resolvase|nr:MAG: hypothetical protein APU95_05905 [Hadesarchaea archaeon YNP_N21]
MTLSKRRGVNFEYRVAYLFERYGYSWDRSGSSLGIDLKILKNGRLHYLVSCKKTSCSDKIYLPRREVEMLSSAATQAGVKGLVCFGFKRSQVFALTTDQVQKLKGARLSYKISKGDGHPLAKILEDEARAGLGASPS